MLNPNPVPITITPASFSARAAISQDSFASYLQGLSPHSSSSSSSSNKSIAQYDVDMNEYHGEGFPAPVQQTTLPTGLPLSARLKIIIARIDKELNFFRIQRTPEQRKASALRLEDYVTTIPIPNYVAHANSNDPLELERVQASNSNLQVFTRELLSVQAQFDGDRARGADFSLDNMFHVMEEIQETEKRRIVSNVPALQGYALASTPTLTPTYMQDGIAAMTHAKRVQTATTTSSSTGVGFFPTGAGSSDANLDLSTPYLPVLPHPSALPSLPQSTSAATTAIQPPNPTTAPPSTQPPPASTQQSPNHDRQQRDQNRQQRGRDRNKNRDGRGKGNERREDRDRDNDRWKHRGQGQGQRQQTQEKRRQQEEGGKGEQINNTWWEEEEDEGDWGQELAVERADPWSV
jgi:hypothetical protein